MGNYFRHVVLDPNPTVVVVVVYLAGDINGLAKKLELLSAEFFSGNTTVRNELVYVLDALLRLNQLSKKEYTQIVNRL